MASFSRYVRKAVDPGLPLDKRRYTLASCINRIAMPTFRGEIAEDYTEYKQSIYLHLSLRFGFSMSEPSPQQLVNAVGFLLAERNRLREVKSQLDRRRVSRKVRGIRNASRVQRDADYEVWTRAVQRFRDNLKIVP